MADYIKDPDAVLDYSFDWSLWLANSETISTSTFSAVGLTINSDSKTTTSTTAWISGGADGNVYQLSNKITTNQGRTDERSVTIRVKNR